MSEKLNIIILKSILVTFNAFLLISGILTVVLYNFTSSQFFVSIFPAFKDLSILVMGFIALVGFVYSFDLLRIKYSEIVVYLTISLFICVLLVDFFISKAPLSYRAYNFRQLIIFIITFLIFKHFNVIGIRVGFVNKLLVYFTLLVCVFGILEYISPSFFWNELVGLEKYASSRLLGETETDRIYSSDLLFLIGRPVRRMMSFFAEPTALGSFLAMSLALILFIKQKLPFKQLTIFLTGLCGILVLSKIFIISILIVILYKYVLKKPYFFPLILFTLSIYLVSAYLYEGVGKIHGSFAHLFGFYTGFKTMIAHPIGLGLGMAGNRGIEMYRSTFGEFGCESGLGSVLAQLGIPGLLFPGVILAIMLILKRKFVEYKSSEYLGLFVMFFLYMVNFCLSYASLGVSGNVFYFIFSGLYLNKEFRGELNGHK